jgi:putative oxidoreductase
MSTLSTILAAILGAVFVAVGIPKITGQEKVAANFERWGYPEQIRVAIGAMEVLAGVLLLVGIAVPAVAITGFMILFIIMLGALSTHQRAKDPLTMWIPPFVLLVLVIVLGISLLP